MLRLSRTAGNRAVAQLIAGRASPSRMSAVRLQRKHVLPDDQKVAIDRLQEAFPGITIEGNLGEKDDRFWETYMKDQQAPVTLEQFVRSLLLRFLPAAVRSGVKVTLSSEGALPASDGGQTDPMGKGIRRVGTPCAGGVSNGWTGYPSNYERRLRKHCSILRPRHFAGSSMCTGGTRML